MIDLIHIRNVLLLARENGVIEGNDTFLLSPEASDSVLQLMNAIDEGRVQIVRGEP